MWLVLVSFFDSLISPMTAFGDIFYSFYFKHSSASQVSIKILPFFKNSATFTGLVSQILESQGGF